MNDNEPMNPAQKQILGLVMESFGNVPAKMENGTLHIDLPRLK